MQQDSVASIVGALNEAGARYLIAGGLAVVAHGYVRFTADFDLIVDLDEDNARRALKVLAALGYRPRAPVPIEDFARADKRAAWIAEKGMTVFSLHSPRHPATEVDIFVEAPLPFQEAHARAYRAELAPGIEAPFIGYDDLLALKRKAGRPQDRLDIEKLDAIRRERADG